MNRRRFSRLLLALAASLYGLGALAHAKAFFVTARSALETTSLKTFFISELKVLWLADSTTLAGLALIMAYIAIRPRSADRQAIFLIALIPAGTTALLYVFLGPFYAAHLLLCATLMVIAAAFLLPRNDAHDFATLTQEAQSNLPQRSR